MELKKPTPCRKDPNLSKRWQRAKCPCGAYFQLHTAQQAVQLCLPVGIRSYSACPRCLLWVKRYERQGSLPLDTAPEWIRKKLQGDETSINVKNTFTEGPYR